MPGKETVTLLVDMTGVDAMIGTVYALDSIGRQSRYMKDLIQSAAINANKEFDREIIAYASASGRMGHMFEWGTIGINTSKSNMALSPDDAEARLWNFEFIPGNSVSRLNFTYRPSVGTVPKPPLDKTEIPSKVVDKLKDHIFYNKAMVMEEGIPVTIKPKPENVRKLLFVPNIWKGEPGYSMYAKSTHPDISRTTKGTFTAMWNTFWNGAGQEAMQGEVEKNFEHDLYEVFKMMKAKGKTGRIHIPDNTVDGQSIKVSTETARKYFERAAATRLAMDIKTEDRIR